MSGESNLYLKAELNSKKLQNYSKKGEVKKIE